MKAVNLLEKIAVHNTQHFDFKEFGGPGRDRTDDLFHAMAGGLTKSTTYNGFRGCQGPVST
jgi:hypothetical protein